jgi:GT2 family glycosyltransferase
VKLSVVIVNYNVRYFLEQCIRSLLRATSNLESEIIVVDNQSTDDSCQMIKEQFPFVQLIENRENVGFSKANNQGVRMAKGEFICILNPDTVVPEDTFLKAFQYCGDIDNLGALGVRYLDGTGNFLPESKRNVPTPTTSLLKLLGFTKKYYATHLDEKEHGPVAVLAGAFMLLRRAVYEQVGGFDEDYFMYGEDIDLSYKITQAGYINHYFGGAKIVHYKGESTRKDAAYYDRFYGAMKIFYYKHFTANPLFDTMVNLGVWAAKSKKRPVGDGEQGTLPQPKQAMVFTENLHVLRGITDHLDLPLKTVSKAKLSEEEIQHSMLIFDADYMSFGQIISVMETLRNRGNIFRIRPSNCRFLVGSDRSDHKGSVLVF